MEYYYAMQANRVEPGTNDKHRYFGRDLTNFEGAGVAASRENALIHTREGGRDQHRRGDSQREPMFNGPRDAHRDNLKEGLRDAVDIQPGRSGLKGSNRRAGLTKPSPVQFYKGLFENQRNLHRRGNTNENNKSTSVEQSGNNNLSKSRLRNDKPVKQDVVKNKISRLLRSKGRVSGQLLSTEEGSQDRLHLTGGALGMPGTRIENQQVVSRDRVGGDLKPNTTRAADGQQIFSNNKFASLINMGNGIHTKDRTGNRRTPSNMGGAHQKSCGPNSSNDEKLKSQPKGPALAQKFKNLRLQLDERETLGPTNTEVIADADLGNPLLSQNVIPLSQQPASQHGNSAIAHTGGLTNALPHLVSGISANHQPFTSEYLNQMQLESTKPNLKSGAPTRHEIIANELDELPAAKPLGSNDTSMAGRLDIPFIWDYLLATEVCYSLP